MTERPRCRRCKCPLDIWRDPETGVGLVCNNPRPMQTDEEFFRRLADMGGDDVARLERSALRIDK